MLDGATGLLYEHADDRGLASGILSLLHDPRRAWALGTAGQRSVEEHFGQERFTSNMVRLYQQVLHGRRSAVPSIPEPIRAVSTVGELY